jgi:N-acetylglucosamine kinase-like BadF-type ATPase
MVGLGFNSGGTRTTYAIDLGDGPTRPPGSEIGDSLSSARGGDSTQAAINWIVDLILSQDSEEVVTWIGAAGFSASTAESVKHQFTPRLHDITAAADRGQHFEIFITNDAVAILKAPPLNGAGVAAIVGTGSVVMGFHPTCSEGVVKRGGFEWLVSDEGSGVWMTLETVRRLLHDIQEHGSEEYNSILLERLADYLGITVADTRHVPATHRALAKADLIARRISEDRHDTKRFLAHFAYPNIFDTAVLSAGNTSHDRIAAEVLRDSVRIIANHITYVADVLAAHTADEPNLRQKQPVVVGGSIASNPLYAGLLDSALSSSRSVQWIETIGDAADELAALSAAYLAASSAERSRIARSLDPLHPVLRLV